MKEILLLTSVLFFNLCQAQTLETQDWKATFVKVDSIVSSINFKKSLTRGIVEGTDESSEGFTWSAYFYYDKQSSEIFRIAYSDSASIIEYYFFDSQLIKIINDGRRFYKVGLHYLDAGGKKVDPQVKEDIERATAFKKYISKLVR